MVTWFAFAACNYALGRVRIFSYKFLVVYSVRILCFFMGPSFSCVTLGGDSLSMVTLSILSIFSVSGVIDPIIYYIGSFRVGINLVMIL